MMNEHLVITLIMLAVSVSQSFEKNKFLIWLGGVSFTVAIMHIAIYLGWLKQTI